MVDLFEGQRLENLLVAGTPFRGLPYINHLMGYIRANHDGYRWWHTIFRTNQQIETPERTAELDALYNLFVRQIKGLPNLKEYCEQHLTCVQDEYNAYHCGKHGTYTFCFRLEKGDYNLCLNAFTPDAMPKTQAAHENIIPAVE